MRTPDSAGHARSIWICANTACTVTLQETINEAAQHAKTAKPDHNRTNTQTAAKPPPGLHHTDLRCRMIHPMHKRAPNLRASIGCYRSHTACQINLSVAAACCSAAQFAAPYRICRAWPLQKKVNGQYGMSCRSAVSTLACTPVRTAHATESTKQQTYPRHWVHMACPVNSHLPGQNMSAAHNTESHPGTGHECRRYMACPSLLHTCQSSPNNVCTPAKPAVESWQDYQHKATDIQQATHCTVHTRSTACKGCPSSKYDRCNGNRTDRTVMYDVSHPVNVQVAPIPTPSPDPANQPPTAPRGP